jgi:V8-like Glu-specific endopeptidase
MMNRIVLSVSAILALSAFAGCSGGEGGGLEGDTSASATEALESKAGWVSLGSGECSLLNGVKACYNYVADTFTCTAGTCIDLSASKTQLACDGANDCGAGQICCFESVYISNQTKCMAASACKDESAGRYSYNREQVCDTTSECSTGTCQLATENASGRYLPDGWSTCR